MFDFHSDKSAYFRIQYENARNYVVPFIDQVFPLQPFHRVLEVGCAEGGVLKAFAERVHLAVGVELSTDRAASARKFLSSELEQGKVFIVEDNIYNVSRHKPFDQRFDIIVLKDVIEHIADQRSLLQHLAQMLSDSGVLFIGFPPWQMPFGGHQQICRHRVLARTPYIHLLPTPLYRNLLHWGGESSATVHELLQIKQTGLSIETFEKYLQQAQLCVWRRQWYIINPIYKAKFGLAPQRLPRWVAVFPYLRNFLTTAAYYVVGLKPKTAS